MAGPSITLAIEVDVSVIPEADLGAVMSAISDAGLAPVLEQIGEIMGDAQRENFASQGQTFGRPWAALAPSTVAEKQRHGFPPDPMVRSHDLSDQIGETIAVDGGSVEAGIDTAAVPYAMRHQPEDQGGDNSGGGRLPARILAGFSGTEIEEIRQTLLDAIEQRTGLTAGIDVVVLED